MGVLLYCVTSRTSGKSYVGITARTLRARWLDHVNRAVRGSTLKFHAAIRKYGADDFEIETLFSYAQHEDAAHAEVELIAALDLMLSGYNSAPGGDINPMTGRTHSPAARQKIRETHKGRRRSAETCARLKAANANVSAETREKIRQSRLGKKHTATTRRKISEAKRNPSPATRAKMRASHLGKRIPPDVRAKMSAAQKSRDPEKEKIRREKCRAAALRYWQDRRSTTASRV